MAVILVIGCFGLVYFLSKKYSYSGFKKLQGSLVVLFFILSQIIFVLQIDLIENCDHSKGGSENKDSSLPSSYMIAYIQTVATMITTEYLVSLRMKITLNVIFFLTLILHMENFRSSRTIFAAQLGLMLQIFLYMLMAKKDKTIKTYLDKL